MIPPITSDKTFVAVSMRINFKSPLFFNRRHKRHTIKRPSMDKYAIIYLIRKNFKKD